MCVYHTQFVEYALSICCHMENGFIIILIVSINSPSPHVQEKKYNGKAEKANTKVCITGKMVLNPRKGEYNITSKADPYHDRQP